MSLFVIFLIIVSFLALKEFNASLICFIYSGVVPQHPPTILTPHLTISAIISAKYFDESEYTVFLPIHVGYPALGIIEIILSYMFIDFIY